MAWMAPERVGSRSQGESCRTTLLGGSVKGEVEGMHPILRILEAKYTAVLQIILERHQGEQT
jgi:hypothetical protein